MRGAFTRVLTELAAHDPRIFLLTGDLGYLALEPFAERFPERFINVGVAEQNMIGMATGLAEAGYIPFAYSIVTFATLRPYEFIRNGPIVHQLPVRIVGVGGGVEYGHNGKTHYGLEDIGVMRVQPGITLIAPCDHQQAASALRQTWSLPGPIYYRLGKDDRVTVPGLDGRFRLGRMEVIREGSDVLIITAGSVSTEAVASADLLHKNGVSAQVAVLSSFNPAPSDDLRSLIARHTVVITVESHYQSGGLFSLVAEIVATSALGCRVIPCAVKHQPDGMTGSQRFLHNQFGLCPDSIANAAIAGLAVNPFPAGGVRSW